MTELLIKVVVSYLLGSLIGSLIVGRLRGGVDIRTLGSGNAGGTNALRTQGKVFAFWVMVIDIGKGIVATRLIPPLTVSPLGVASAGASVWSGWLPVACGFAAMVGHVYPVWHGFRGGKGVATLVGVLFGLDALLLLGVLLTWLAVAVLFGFVGLASIAAAASVPAFIALSGMQPRVPLLTFGVAAALLVIFTHRSNISRMRSGHEPRARRLWLFGRGRA
ncbi:MAG TPA: glycerol-3-phosphate 1-O-acyltransferase PlsY [Steroidobacteraceae bacterium]|nr:glycerol-3-phosphate 1-O-acyltransferase PlsY [Steroidobacteraceae bacterium]